MYDYTPSDIKEALCQVASSHDQKSFKKWIVGFVLIFSFALVVAAWYLIGASKPMQYNTQPVRLGDLLITTTSTGKLVATNLVEVGSEISGIIKEMTADYNDAVTAGQPLAYIDDSKYTAAVMQSRAQVVLAEAKLAEAKTDHNSNKKKLVRLQTTFKLTKGKLPSQQEIEEAEANVQKSTATVAAAAADIMIAKASLKSNEADLDKTVIYSPINGIVLKKDVMPGQTVASSSLEAPVLYTLAEDLRHMELHVAVDEADIGSVKKGQRASFTVDAYPDHTFEAKILQVRYSADKLRENENVVTYKTILSVANSDLLLRPGMTATVKIIVKKVENTLMVPNAALRYAPSEPNSDKQPTNYTSKIPSVFASSSRPLENNGDGDAASDIHDNKSCVWILKDNHPMPVEVQKRATDGVMTAVTSRELKEGMEIIINAIVADE